jgi:Rod binding domain-containing protein
MDINSIVSSSPLSVPGVLGQPMKLNSTPAEQRHAVAGQFEAILLRQFLNQSVGSMMGGEDTAQGSVYGYLLGDVLSQKLAAGGGLGLSKVIEQQLTPSGQAAASASKGAS